MSKTKQFYEDLAILAATALCEESAKVDEYYANADYADVEESVMCDIFNGNADDVMDELVTCMFEYESDLAAEFPKSFSAVCVMQELVDTPSTLSQWLALIGAASNQPLFEALIDAYKEYRDMSDPWISEAKVWIGDLMYQHEYSGLLDDINAVIEGYELTEEESPVTFRAKALLESIVNS